MGKPILCLDFDGVIHSYRSGWHGEHVVMDEPTPGAIEFLHEAAKVFSLAIHSSRSKSYEGKKAMRGWLTEQIARYYAANGFSPTGARGYEDAREWIGENIDFPDSKPPAHLTIDDRAITFCGRWPSPKELLDFKPWNKRQRHTGLQRFKRKHTEIEAYQWDGESLGPGLKRARGPILVTTSLDENGDPNQQIEERDYTVVVNREGVEIPIQPGTWIVAEPDGAGWYPVVDPIFNDRYDPLE